MEFAQTSAILEFYIWFRFWPYHRSRHVMQHQSAKFYPNITALSRKKWLHVDFQDGESQPSWILGVIMGCLKIQCTTSYRSSIETIALNSLVFEKIAFFCILATDRQTDEQMNSTDALSRCRERRLNNERTRQVSKQHSVLKSVSEICIVRFAVASQCSLRRNAVWPWWWCLLLRLQGFAGCGSIRARTPILRKAVRGSKIY